MLEVKRFVTNAFCDHKRSGQFDLESLEHAARETAHKIGAEMLEKILIHEDGSSMESKCACGGAFSNQKNRSKTIHTILGTVRVCRAIQQCNRCKQWRIPYDIMLDVQNSMYSPGMQRIMAQCGAAVSFGKSRDLIKELAGQFVTDKDVDRIAERIGTDIQLNGNSFSNAPEKESPSTLYIATDGTGVPVIKKETTGRIGKASDGIAKTREAKLGAIFTQSRADEKGNPIRDPFSTTYIGRIESVGEFGPRLLDEAIRRSAFQAKQIVILGDGAPWIWNLAEKYFPDAIQIIDFYHAKEHLADISKLLYSHKCKERDILYNNFSEKLWDGPISKLLKELRLLKLQHSKNETLETMIDYFWKNHTRMEYKNYRQKGFFIGSGVIEAGCKSIIGHRLKQSGMHWSVNGANAIIALKCCIESGYFETYWESRAAA